MPDLGFLAFTLPHVEILRPTKQPRGQALPLEEQRATQALHSRRLRIEPVHSSVKRCRVVKDRIRLWKQGIRDLVMALCGALHTFRVASHTLAIHGFIGIDSSDCCAVSHGRGRAQRSAVWSASGYPGARRPQHARISCRTVYLSCRLDP